MTDRAEVATKAAVDLLRLGMVTFAPIPYNCHWEKYNLPSDWGFWEPFDKTFLDHVSALIVLQIPGWDVSKGVTAEIEYAKDIGLPIYYLTVEQIAAGDIEHIINPNSLSKQTWG